MRPCCLLPLLLLFPCVSAQDESTGPAEGHSVHGEVFNEGPRQAAVRIAGTGDVRFPVTSEDPRVQPFFDQGVGQLHGFWDFEAERSFRQAAAFDPDCAMNYWGMAMANFKNDTRGKGFAEEAKKRRDQASEREQLWIDGIAAYFADTKLDQKKRLRDFVRSIEKIANKYPDDVEAKAFLMKQIYYNHGKGLEIPSHYAIDLLLDQILAADPDHPAHHYRIHLWDKEDAAKALASAAACGPAAPGIAHMWHMPGHIYSKLHRYADAVYQQEASARIDHAHMIRYRIVPDQIHNFAHNNEWCIRNLDQLGQHARAVELSRNMISLPRLAKFTKKDDPDTYDPKGSSWAYGRTRLRDSLVRFEQWDELIARTEDGLLGSDGKSIEENEVDRFLGIARFESGDSEGGNQHLATLEKKLSEKTEARDKAVADARQKATDAKKDEKGIEEAEKAARKEFEKDIASLESLVAELRAYAALTDEPPRSEDAREQLGKTKDIVKHRLALLWHRAGDAEKALSVSAEAVKAAPGQVLPLAARVEILHANDKTDEAREVFATLRETGHLADIDTAPLVRLAPIAETFGWPADWRTAPAPADDLGERPSLDSLGPFRWTPPVAPDLLAFDPSGKAITLSDFAGKNVLFLFFLGAGCEHCVEQLDAFAKEVEAYREAGIELVAVSIDPASKAPEGYPFPILSDDSLDSFRAYRAFDDFENMALHGTFLVDGDKRIRWQDIGYEPFMHPGWLLEESKRLLAIGEPES